MQNKNNPLTFFDTFSGIGGFRLGLESAGFKAMGFCEKDRHCIQLYEKFFQTEGEFKSNDISSINPKQLPDFDILTGGFPCQSFSLAGKRKGFEDQRGSLIFDVLRICAEKRPRYLLLENVKGLLSHDSGKTFTTILGLFTDLGYCLEWCLLNSKDFGVPQNRERVFIVGYLGRTGGRKIFPLKTSHCKNTSEIRQLELTKGNSQGNRIYSTDGISTCLTSNGGGQGGKTGLYFINKPRFDKYKPSQTVETLKVGGDTPLMRLRNGTKKGYDEAREGDGINLAFPNSKTRRGRVGKQVSQTLDTNCNMGTIDNFRIRRLTPLECFRLQGFPDEMVKKARGLGFKDNTLYKMAGNAVTVNVVEAIVHKLREVHYDD